MDTLRSRVIRLAYAQPAFRPHLLPLLKQAGSFPRVTREVEDDYKRKAITSRERDELLESIENAETEREAQKIVADHRKGRTAAADPDAVYRDALENLSDLAELSENVRDVIDGFNLHYASRRNAGMDPEIQSERQVFDKASGGLALAEQTVKSLTGLVSMFPADKKYAKTLADATKMRDTLAKQVEASRKIIRTLSEKKAPKALTDMAKKVKAKLLSKLIDPSKVDFFFNQFTDYRGSVMNAAIFSATFAGEHASRNVALWLTEFATGAAGVQMSMGDIRSPVYNSAPATEDGAASLFLKALQGWDNLKGEAEGRASRESTAKAVARAIDSVTDRMAYSRTEEAKISPDFRTIEGAYRSGLPREGARDVGSYEYERRVDAETARADKVLTPALAPYKDMIARVSIYAEEKSWIYIRVTLK